MTEHADWCEALVPHFDGVIQGAFCGRRAVTVCRLPGPWYSPRCSEHIEGTAVSLTTSGHRLRERDTR